MALLVSPAPYLGTDREGVVSEICARIRRLAPDIVGLCEVFSDGERTEISTALQDLYPFVREGPDEDDLESDGGLLLLSRFPLLAVNDFIFRDCDGVDCLANKGILHIRVRGPSWPSALDVLYSHTQNISTSNGQSALYAQLEKMRDFVQRHADIGLPALIMGDLNIPATTSVHYRTLLNTLGGFRDAWTLAGNAVTSGPTYVADNNFYDDTADRPGSDERLDYILLRPGSSACPVTADVEVMRFTYNGRFISDHFGVLAVFDPIAVVDP
ncbi:endonuclease/exonuclease/phosphatase family protein (plasmid) [Rhodococcus opacus]|uniref:Endonuclease/exonuclease/phosphatase family protein n=1 Tax=Rhodococcus opacus TaxID=37919 RepID=A0ABT4NLG9_RHOOP|nr:endonuclease/exonuclease/phosphatase family protein [Rhodococcus opacus]MCZ4588219.1 endonuclease/exonuclease/phosphatase family protein [Rhodococcus opacus]MDV7087618.1 endonuclease/exonuclease/phosphatase family protein [Rhodococcus opacus]WKN61098.1 endonuclease/exonuclease/phosphatase family protein [Rhodococcus opacus]